MKPAEGAPSRGTVEAGVAAKVLHALHHPTLKLVIDVHKAEHIAGVAGSSVPSVDSANLSGAFGIFEKAGFTPKMRYMRWALEI